MCKAPKPPKPKEPKKPEFLRNRYLDEFMGQSQMVNSLRQGRAQFRIPLGAPAGITGRQPGESLVRVPAGQPNRGGAGGTPSTGRPGNAGPRRIGPRANLR